MSRLPGCQARLPFHSSSVWDKGGDPWGSWSDLLLFASGRASSYWSLVWNRENKTTEVYQQPCLCAVPLGWLQCLFLSVLSSWFSMNPELSLPVPVTFNSSSSSLYSQLPLNVSYPWLHLNNTHSVSFWWCFWVWHLFWILLLFWKELSKFLGHLGSHLNQMIKRQRLLFQIADDSRQLWDSRE